MSKQDKHIQQMAHPQMLFTYGGRATLAQAFAIVEQLDRGLCVEEAGRLPTVMIGSTNPPRDPPSGRPSQPPSQVVEVEVEGVGA